MFPSIYIVYTYYIGLDNTLYTFDVPLICLPHFPGTSACSHHRLGGIGACGSFHALWLGAKPKRQVLKKWEMPLPLSDFKDFYLNLEVTIYIYICMWYIYIHVVYNTVISMSYIVSAVSLGSFPAPLRNATTLRQIGPVCKCTSLFCAGPKQKIMPMCSVYMYIYICNYIILYHIIILCHVLLHYILWRCVILYYINFSV